MKKRNVLAFMLCVWSVCSWAQKVTVSGTVIEEDTNEPAFSASAVLLKTTDSTLVTGASSNLEGKFSIPGVKPGKYIFRVTSVGFKPYYKDVVLVASKPSMAIGTIKLQTNAALLDAVEVTARQAQVEMKADTFVYNAGAYRVPEGSALEELVKKLPGAEVSEDGTITINGKEVKKIMIDGKEFFDNDTKVAMKNLPTNMVEKIKAYDRKSDYTRMTGIDDGEEETVIDLSVKPEKKLVGGCRSRIRYGRPLYGSFHGEPLYRQVAVDVAWRCQQCERPWVLRRVPWRLGRQRRSRGQQGCRYGLCLGER